MATKKKLSDLYDRCQDTINSYGERDQQLDNLGDYYFVELTDEEKNPAEGIEVVKLPLGTNVVDLVQDLLVNAEFTLSCPTLGLKQKQKQLADDSEKFLHATMRQSERAQRQHLISRAAWTAAMRGAVAGRVQVIDDWFDRDEGGKRQVGRRIPILIQLRDPRWLYPELGLDGLDYMVEKQDRTVRDIQHSYGSRMLEGKDPSEQVEWLEYWDDTTFCYWAGGEVVKLAGKGKLGPWPHQYGGNPYSYEFCRQTGHLEPEKRARPFLESVTHVIDRLNFLASQEATFTAHYIGTAWWVESEAMSQEGGPRLDLTTGAQNYAEPGEKVSAIQAGRRPLELDVFHQKLEGVLERGTFPSTLYGESVGPSAAGYMVSLLNQSGQVKLNPMVAAIERLISSLCENVLMVAEHYVAPMIAGPLPFFWVDELTDETTGESVRGESELTFDASMLEGAYQVEVNLGNLMPADEVGDMQLAQQARTPGVSGLPLLSDETIADRYLNVKSPTDERERIAREMARNDPEVLALERAVLVAEAKEELRERLEELDIDVDDVLDQVEGAMNPQPQELEAPPEMLPKMMPQAGPPPPMMDPGIMPQQQPEMPPEIAAAMGMGPPMPPEMV